MKRPLVIHPLLFAIFPILSLFAHNIAVVFFKEIIPPSIAAIIFTLLLFFFLDFILKDKQKAGLIATLFVFLFFSYGHFYGLIKYLMPNVIKLFDSVSQKAVFLSGAIIFILCAYFCVKTRRRLINLTNFLNVVSVSLIVICSVNIGLYELKSVNIWQNKGSLKNSEINTVDSKHTVKPPNIYYIILDGYARGDILKELYHYDNAGFLNYLIKKGFYIASQSSSNYCQTNLSLASSLNMEYLDSLNKAIDVKDSDRKFLVGAIKNNAVFRFLKKYGYTTIAFSSGYYGTEIEKADIYISAGPSINLFQNELINITPLPVIFSVFFKEREYDLHRGRIMSILYNLKNISKKRGPYFVFAHIFCPHPPFVFGPRGEKLNPTQKFMIGDGSHLLDKIPRDKYIEGYKKQLEFLNIKIEETIDAIMSSSPEPPVMILQADHGPGSMLSWNDARNTNFKERMSILNAYYLPGDGKADLYPSITPVNTFRVVFNRYFETNYNLLNDKSYFSTWSHPYKFIEYTDKVRE